MSAIQKQVAAALASGEWKEKLDAASGRKYYTNARLKKSTWNLAKFLASPEAAAGGGGRTASSGRRAGASGGTAGGDDTGDSAHDEAQELATREERQRRVAQHAASEAALQAAIADLEREKVGLEGDIARLEGPVEAEEARLLALRAELADLEFSLQAVEKGVHDKRRHRHHELTAVTSRVEALRSSEASEQQYRTAVAARHARLVAETTELRADLHKEQVTLEALRSAVRAAERRLEEADAELGRQKAEIATLEELTAGAEQELAEVSLRKNDTARRIEAMAQERDELQARLGAIVATEARASAAAAAAVAGGRGTTDLLGELMQRYDEKRRALAAVTREQECQDTVALLEYGNFKLRTLCAAAERDGEALAKLARLVGSELQRTLAATAELRNGLQALRQEARELEATHGSTWAM